MNKIKAIRRLLGLTVVLGLIPTLSVTLTGVWAGGSLLISASTGSLAASAAWTAANVSTGLVYVWLAGPMAPAVATFQLL